MTPASKTPVASASAFELWRKFLLSHDNLAQQSIFQDQAGRLRKLVHEAETRHPHKTKNLTMAIAQLLSGSLQGNAALCHADIHDGLATEATTRAAAGDAEAAYLWGCAAYVAQRRFAHAWLLLLRLAFAAGKLRQIPVGESDFAPTGVSPAIPSMIMQFWDTEAIPPDVADLVNGWASCKGFAHTLLNEKAASEYIAAHYGAYAQGIYNSLPFVASKADLFRLCWILKEGGIYVDADEQLIGGLASLVPNDAGLILNWTDADTPCVNNWFIAARHHHPLVSHAYGLALSHIVQSKGRQMGLSAWLLTGPGVFTMSILDLLCDEASGAGIFDDIVFHAEHDFRQIVLAHDNLSYKTDPKKNWRLNEFNW